MASSSADMFIPIKFNTSVQLKPNELGPNLEDIIYTKLKNNLENMCSKHGYIKKNSIKIIKRSIGQINIAHFNGNILFNLQCVAEICNPAQGSIVKCRVKAKNSMGLMAEGYYDNIPILQIIIPKISAGIQSEVNIDTISIGDEINIEVCGKKFLLFDKYISIIGKVIKDKAPNIKNNINDIADDPDALDDDKIDEIDNIVADGLEEDLDDDEKSEMLGGEGDDEEDLDDDAEDDQEEDVEDEEIAEEDEDDEIEGGDLDDIGDELGDEIDTTGFEDIVDDE